jgi:uncharacterized protein
MSCKFKTFQMLLCLALGWAYPVALEAVTPPIPAQPAQYVVDLAGVLDADTRARLNARLKDLETETTAQMVVLTLNSLEGEPIESFSHQTAVQWGIGQKGKDNGVLLTVAVKDHKYRLEVGYGLESALPDSLVGSIGREYLVPNFRKGDYAAGIVAAVTEIVKNLSAIQAGSEGGEGAASPPQEEAPKVGTPSANPKGLIFAIVMVILSLGSFAFFIPRIINWAVRGKGSSSGIWFSGGGGGSSWSSGGGFGDSGGFSGGRGDFGGGGASGDW